MVFWTLLAICLVLATVWLLYEAQHRLRNWKRKDRWDG